MLCLPAYRLPGCFSLLLAKSQRAVTSLQVIRDTVKGSAKYPLLIEFSQALFFDFFKKVFS